MHSSLNWSIRIVHILLKVQKLANVLDFKPHFILLHKCRLLHKPCYRIVKPIDLCTVFIMLFAFLFRAKTCLDQNKNVIVLKKCFALGVSFVWQIYLPKVFLKIVIYYVAMITEVFLMHLWYSTRPVLVDGTCP